MITASVALLAAIAVQVSLMTSRNVAVSTINDVALQSQDEAQLVCADERFKKYFADSILARQSAFEYKVDPVDFPSYHWRPAKESITDYNLLIVYQSSLAYAPTRISEARQRMQHIGIIRDIPVKKYPLLLSNAQ